MILFVFEGERREPALFHMLEAAFFGGVGEQRIVCSYCSNIYSLYQKMTADAGSGDFVEDLVPVLKTVPGVKSDKEFDEAERASDFSEIYLFFDYDCQHRGQGDEPPLVEKNRRVQEMLAFFSDETGHGKLYLNYPMVEAVRYTKSLPDCAFGEYAVAVGDCGDFKRIAAAFSYYPNLDFIAFRRAELHEPSQERLQEIKSNWRHLVRQHVAKAALICTGKGGFPPAKQDVAPSCVFLAQVKTYVEPLQKVAILCAFPLFLFDYFKADVFGRD